MLLFLYFNVEICSIRYIAVGRILQGREGRMFWGAILDSAGKVARRVVVHGGQLQRPTGALSTLTPLPQLVGHLLPSSTRRVCLPWLKAVQSIWTHRVTRVTGPTHTLGRISKHIFSTMGGSANTGRCGYVKISMKPFLNQLFALCVFPLF